MVSSSFSRSRARFLSSSPAALAAALGPPPAAGATIPELIPTPGTLRAGTKGIAGLVGQDLGLTIGAMALLGVIADETPNRALYGLLAIAIPRLSVVRLLDRDLRLPKGGEDAHACA